MNRVLLVAVAALAGAAAALAAVWVADGLDIVIWRDRERYQRWREQW